MIIFLLTNENMNIGKTVFKKECCAKMFFIARMVKKQGKGYKYYLVYILVCSLLQRNEANDENFPYARLQQLMHT